MLTTESVDPRSFRGLDESAAFSSNVGAAFEVFRDMVCDPVPDVLNVCGRCFREMQTEECTLAFVASISAAVGKSRSTTRAAYSLARVSSVFWRCSAS
jgi:hypothetical protein